MSAYISGVPFKYAIKTSVRLLSPEWQPRDKDLAAIHLLDAELDRCGLDRAKLLSQIWSYTPYWAQRGYLEYAAPVVAGAVRASEAER